MGLFQCNVGNLNLNSTILKKKTMVLKYNAFKPAKYQPTYNIQNPHTAPRFQSWPSFILKSLGIREAVNEGDFSTCHPLPQVAVPKICPHLAIHPAILSIHTSPPLPSSSSFLISWSPGWPWVEIIPSLHRNNKGLCLELYGQRSSCFFSISGSITVRNDNVGG